MKKPYKDYSNTLPGAIGLNEDRVEEVAKIGIRSAVHTENHGEGLNVIINDDSLSVEEKVFATYSYVMAYQKVAELFS